MIKKIFIFLFFLSAFSFSLMAQEIIPELKPETIVDDSVITLGDLFTDLSEMEELVVANAPEPGKKIIIPARHILKVTRANNVRWKNSAAVKNVIVKRKSSIIIVSELREILIGELKNNFLTSQDFDLRFYNQNAKIHVPNGYDAYDLTIKNLTIENNGNKFSALIAAPNGNGSEVLHKVNGRTLRVTTIPALSKTVRKGNIINASDIRWVTMPDAQVGRNIIRETEKLIGMTPRTQIKEGMPIRLSEVNRPTLVKRGALVKIHFNTSKISLSAIGKAIENGGKGDVIQVKNNSSDKIITAVVLGENQVRVGTDVSSLVLLNQ